MTVDGKALATARCCEGQTVEDFGRQAITMTIFLPFPPLRPWLPGSAN